jgi:hypothetical protein
MHLVDNHLALTPIWGQLTLDELHQYDSTALASMSAVTVPLIHTLFDCTGLESLPRLSDLAGLQVSKHAQVGWVIFIGVTNPILKFLLATTSQLFHQRLRFFDRHADALAFLAEQDSTLPDLSALDIPALVDQLRAGESPAGFRHIGP